MQCMLRMLGPRRRAREIDEEPVFAHEGLLGKMLWVLVGLEKALKERRSVDGS